MLQIYDRVVPANGVETLIALSLLLAAAFTLTGFLDYTRAALFSAVAQRLDLRLAPRAFDAAMGAKRAAGGGVPTAATALHDLRILRKFLTSPAPATVFDAPWTPIFLLTIYLVHPALGILAVSGGLVLLALAFVNQRQNAKPLETADEAARDADTLVSAYTRNVEVADAMGMHPALRARWGRVYAQSLHDGRRSADGLGAYAAATRVLRLAIQSAMLGLGAYLAILQEITPGIMIAGSILAGRALAPIDQAVGQWRVFVSARNAFRRLRSTFGALPDEEPAPIRLPRAKGIVTAEDVSVHAPGPETDSQTARPILRAVQFRLEPGEVLAVIGPSASGKSTLARALSGAWKTQTGALRLDGAEIANYEPRYRGRQIGYLPQDVELFAGTVAENIARLARKPKSERVLAAAMAAGAHEMVLRLPQGYETQIGPGGAFLSAGQRQRVGLARALYGDPPLVVLDEPNSNLDAAGDAALNQAILTRKRRGRTTILITHRVAALTHVDHVLVLESGEQRMFGPKDAVMTAMTQASVNGDRKVTPIKAAGASA